MYVCLHMYVYMYVYINIQSHPEVDNYGAFKEHIMVHSKIIFYLLQDVCVHTYKRIHIHIYIYVHIYIHTYIYMHTHFV